MSMNPEQENFEALRRVLALKRHEQPPPGFFNDFSQQVISRLRAGEKPEEVGFWEQFFEQAPWLHRIWTVFETKPLFAGAFGIVFSGLLISAAIYSAKFDTVPAAPQLVQKDSPSLTDPGPGAPQQVLGELTSATNSINPVQGQGSVFDGIRLPETRLINFETPNQN